MVHLAATATLAAATTGNQPPVSDALYALLGQALPWLLLALAVWVPVYLLGCWLWPFGNCRGCGGTGKRKAPGLFGKAFRTCPRCDGSGLQLRAGRYVINRLLANYRAARRHDERRERQL
jgi:hypothetical protein